MARFITVVRRARFVYSPFTAGEMAQFGDLLATTIRTRIQAGQNVYDQPAAPLKPGRGGRPGYPEYKARRGLAPVRNWTWTGHTLRCLKCIMANENRAVIAFLNESFPGRSLTASQIAFYNNQREHQYGVSERDRAFIVEAMRAYRPIVTIQEIAQGAYFAGLRQVGAAQYFAALTGGAQRAA